MSAVIPTPRPDAHASLTRLCGTLRWLLPTLLLWAAVVTAGFWGLWTYASLPGLAEAAPLLWPAESALERTPGRLVLVMFVHPRCPCTQASLTELEKLVARSAGRLDVRIASLEPANAAANWSDSSIARRARLLPGATILADLAGKEARRFHANTSGETLLYDPAGRLVYHGGITAARGHEGDNPGADAILALLAGGEAPAACPAFGCPLFSDNQADQEATP